MTMTIEAHHHAIMSSAFKGKRPPQDCAWCRMSHYESGRFVCGLNLDQTHAAQCPEFRDSRVQSSVPPEHFNRA